MNSSVHSRARSHFASLIVENTREGLQATPPLLLTVRRRALEVELVGVAWRLIADAVESCIKNGYTRNLYLARITERGCRAMLKRKTLIGQVIVEEKATSEAVNKLATACNRGKLLLYGRSRQNILCGAFIFCIRFSA